MTQRLKVLVSAYACEPGKGSEPGVGWNWVKQLARFHEVWVITRANNREPIERGLEKGPMPNVHWVYFDLPRWMRFWKKGQRGLHLYYYLWQIGAYFVVRRLHREESFDLVHHVTFGTFWMPTFLALLPVPLIWGPVGGGDSSPRAFHNTFSLRGRIYEYFRNLVRWLAQWDPFIRLTSRRAVIALANTENTKQWLHRLGSRNILLYSHMGVSLRGVSANASRRSCAFRLVSVGRLIHWKGFHLGLKAFARFQQSCPSSEYWLIGDGPERRNLQRLARRLDITSKVKFLGTLPRYQVLEKLAECDVLIHPSMHDSAPAVCLEAMAAGLPVICLDLGGPALQVTEETGFKVPAISPEQAVRDMAEAMKRLANEPLLRRQMGEAGRKRVDRYFRWDSKGEWMNACYQEVVSQ